MSFVTSMYIKPFKAALVQSWNGSFVMDRAGRIITSTLPSSLSAAKIRFVADEIFGIFQSMDKSGSRLSEIVVRYAGLELRASHSAKRTSVWFIHRPRLGK